MKQISSAQQLIERFEDRAIVRSDWSRVMAYKWLRIATETDDADIMDKIQVIHYKGN